MALTALSPSFLLTSFAALPAMAQDAPADIPSCSYSFDPEHASAEARFTVADITTVASDLAKRILDPDVFDTSDPADTAIIFKSTAVNGVTKPIVRDETFKNAGQHPRQRCEMVALDAQTSVVWTEFNLGIGVSVVTDAWALRMALEALRSE